MADDDIPAMVEDLEARESKLSEWEQGFVASVSDQLARGRGLSEKQYATLNRIWERVT